MKQKDLCEKLKLSKQVLNEAISGRVTHSTHHRPIAAALEIPYKWLTEGEGEPPWEIAAVDLRADALRQLAMYRDACGIPIAGRVAAGDGHVEVWKEGDGTKVEIPGGWHTVSVEGKSAYPVVFDGQLAIIDSDRAFRPTEATDFNFADAHDDIVLVQCYDGRALLKRFCYAKDAPGRFILASVNAGRSSPYIPADQIDLILPVVGIVYIDPRGMRTSRVYRVRVGVGYRSPVTVG